MNERKSTKSIQLDLDTYRLKCIVIGDIGTGKSVFAASFPTPGYVFNFDNKVAAYAGADWEYIDLPSTALGWVMAEKEKTAVGKEVKEGKFKTVVIDSTTALHTLAVERAMQIDPKRSEVGGPIWNCHYQMAATLTDSFIRQVLSWDCNVVVVIHYKAVYDTNGTITSYEPLLPGQSAVKIPGLFDEIYRAFTKTEKGKTIYKISTVPRGLYKIARSGLSGKNTILPEELPNDFNALIEAYTTNKNN